MGLTIKGMRPGVLFRAACQPTGIVMGLVGLVCILAIMLLVPWSQYALAGILGLGLAALFALLTLHTLALTRWAGYLEQSLRSQTREWRPIGKSVERFDSYVHAADLNVGRIAMLQTKLEGRISELERRLAEQEKIDARLLDVELGLDRAGIRISEIECGVEQLKPALVEKKGDAEGKLRKATSKPEARKTFFLHIPKCAGTTVWSVLRSIYGHDDGIIYQVEKQPDHTFNSLDITARRNFSAVGGHGTLEYFSQSLGDLGDYYKITILRDPIDRILSEYNYILMLADKEQTTLRNVSFEDFALHYPCNTQVFNLTSSPTDVAKATDIIQHFFDDWALFPEIESLLSRICAALGSTPQNWSPFNQTNYKCQRSDVSEKTLQLLEDRNAADLALLEAITKKPRIARIEWARRSTAKGHLQTT